MTNQVSCRPQNEALSTKFFCSALVAIACTFILYWHIISSDWTTVVRKIRNNYGRNYFGQPIGIGKLKFHFDNVLNRGAPMTQSSTGVLHELKTKLPLCETLPPIQKLFWQGCASSPSVVHAFLRSAQVLLPNITSSKPNTRIQFLWEIRVPICKHVAWTIFCLPLYHAMLQKRLRCRKSLVTATNGCHLEGSMLHRIISFGCTQQTTKQHYSRFHKHLAKGGLVKQLVWTGYYYFSWS